MRNSVQKTPPHLKGVYLIDASGELYHYGVIGMKWGVRRYQNKDGSLTEAGRQIRELNRDAGDAKYNIRNAGGRAMYERMRSNDSNNFRERLRPYQDEMESHCNRLLNSIRNTRSAVNQSGPGSDQDISDDIRKLYTADDRIRSSVRDAIDAIGNKYMSDSDVERYIKDAVDTLDTLYANTYDYQ